MTSSVQLVGHPEHIELNARVIGTNAVQLLGMKLMEMMDTKKNDKPEAN